MEGGGEGCCSGNDHSKFASTQTFVRATATNLELRLGSYHYVLHMFSKISTLGVDVFLRSKMSMSQTRVSWNHLPRKRSAFIA